MSLELKAKERRCRRYGKTFASPLRFQHHLAAEHPVKTFRDIRTMHDIQHRPTKVALSRVNTLSTRRQYEQPGQS